MCCRSVSCCTTVPMLHCCFLSLLSFCLVESVYKTALSCSVIVHISRNPYSRKQSHNLGHIKYLGFYKQTWDGQNSDEPNAQCFIFYRRVYSLQREIHDVPEGKRLRQLQVSDAVKRVLGMPNGPVRYPVKNPPCVSHPLRLCWHCRCDIFQSAHDQGASGETGIQGP